MSKPNHKKRGNKFIKLSPAILNHTSLRQNFIFVLDNWRSSGSSRGRATYSRPRPRYHEDRPRKEDSYVSREEPDSYVSRAPDSAPASKRQKPVVGMLQLIPLELPPSYFN